MSSPGADPCDSDLAAIRERTGSGRVLIVDEARSRVRLLRLPIGLSMTRYESAKGSALPDGIGFKGIQRIYSPSWNHLASPGPRTLAVPHQVGRPSAISTRTSGFEL